MSINSYLFLQFILFVRVEVNIIYFLYEKYLKLIMVKTRMINKIIKAYFY